jgi:hypothetical protein
MTWEEELAANVHLFDGTKRAWSPDQVALCYRIYNGYHNDSKRDTGCGSCRKNVIANCRKIAVEFAKNNPPGNN